MTNTTITIKNDGPCYPLAAELFIALDNRIRGLLEMRLIAVKYGLSLEKAAIRESLRACIALIRAFKSSSYLGDGRFSNEMKNLGEKTIAELDVTHL